MRSARSPHSRWSTQVGLALSLFAPALASAALTWDSVPPSGACDEKVEVTFSLDDPVLEAYSNPYNADQIHVRLEYQCLGCADAGEVPAFWYERWEDDPSNSAYRPVTGSGTWMARFTPRHASETYRMRLRADVGPLAGSSWSYVSTTATVTTSAASCDPNGFVEMVGTGTRAFAFDRRPSHELRLFGINLPQKYGFQRRGARARFDKASETLDMSGRTSADGAGWPFIVLREDAKFLGVEACMLDPASDGVSQCTAGFDWGELVFSQEASHAVDEIYALAEARGWLVLHNLWNHNYGAENISPNSPYRSIGKTLYDDSPHAARIQRDRLRYAVGRWGYSRAMMGWSVITEGEFSMPCSAAECRTVDWAAARVADLGALEAAAGRARPISANFKQTPATSNNADAEILFDRLHADTDFVQDHIYKSHTYADTFERVAQTGFPCDGPTPRSWCGQPKLVTETGTVSGYTGPATTHWTGQWGRLPSTLCPGRAGRPVPPSVGEYDLDCEWDAFHNALFGGLATGMAGAAVWSLANAVWTSEFDAPDVDYVLWRWAQPFNVIERLLKVPPILHADYSTVSLALKRLAPPAAIPVPFFLPTSGEDDKYRHTKFHDGFGDHMIANRFVVARTGEVTAIADRPTATWSPDPLVRQLRPILMGGRPCDGCATFASGTDCAGGYGALTRRHNQPTFELPPGVDRFKIHFLASVGGSGATPSSFSIHAVIDGSPPMVLATTDGTDTLEIDLSAYAADGTELTIWAENADGPECSGTQRAWLIVNYEIPGLLELNGNAIPATGRAQVAATGTHGFGRVAARWTDLTHVAHGSATIAASFDAVQVNVPDVLDGTYAVQVVDPRGAVPATATVGVASGGVLQFEIPVGFSSDVLFWFE